MELNKSSNCSGNYRSLKLLEGEVWTAGNKQPNIKGDKFGNSEPDIEGISGVFSVTEKEEKGV